MRNIPNSYLGDMIFDKNHIWHPYSSITDNMPVFYVESASGIYLHLKDGRKLIDGMASWWCAIHGYNHPVLNQAVQSQIEKMSHVMFGGLTHEPAISLAKKLVDITPEPLQTVFFADSGSVSVEVAVKMAIQYWRARGDYKRHKLVTILGGYHGDTLGAMSVCDPVNGMHGLFNGVLIEQVFAPMPTIPYGETWSDSDIEPLATLLDQQDEEIAALILEPVVQGAGGMRFYSPAYLQSASRLCKERGILLIADEIATGFGRAGKLFACEHAGISPDIMCVGKALTGGYMTLAATLCTEDVSRTISNNTVFMHGPTFMANPLACKVAEASIELLLSSDWEKKVKEIDKGLTEGLVSCRTLSHVVDVRVLGAIGVVELDVPVNMKKIQPLFVDKGVWVRPFGKLVYLMPPYTINKEELRFLCDAVFSVIAHKTKIT